MNIELKNKIDERLQRIANVLILNASFTNNLGLLNGKMGIAIFFYHYALYTQDEQYREFADDLIDEVYEDIKKNTPIDFANGLTGIGWGVEYLVKNRFVEADTDEALEEIDTAILKYRLSHPVLIKKEDVVFGQGLYQLIRLQSNNPNSEEITTLIKKENLIYLIDECERIIIDKTYLNDKFNELSISQANSFLYFLLNVLKSGFLTLKTTKIILSLLESLIESSLNINLVDRVLLINLLNKLLNLFREKEPVTVIHELMKKISKVSMDNNNGKDHEDIAELINVFTQHVWHTLIYLQASDTSTNELSEKAMDLIREDKWWEKRIVATDIANLSLNNGLAGIGLGILRHLTNDIYSN